ncbi:MAG: PstS family phosphate ABC transporter substrate-binding protein [Saprospiraceae bacterium]|nr:PstS family phosphate ABC transporter substrate-binding protein [Saprospiraceae bacterium]
MKFRNILSHCFYIVCLTILFDTGCNPGPGIEKSPLKGHIRIDGSSTVYPITEAVAEEYRSFTPGVKITIGISGTGGGFNKFVRREVDIADASRHIKEPERKNLQDSGLEFLEIPIAYDGLAVVVNKDNDWIREISVEELKKIWQPSATGTLTRWNQIRKNFPDRPLRLMGPGTASGTFDHFTEAIVGKAGSSRGDFMPSEDDNVLVQGIQGDINGMAFFGLAFANENIDKLRILSVINEKGSFYPDAENIRNGNYSPLSRKLYVYITNESVKKPEVVDFLMYYLDHVVTVIEDVGYIALNPEQYTEAKASLKSFVSKFAPENLKILDKHAEEVEN